MELHSRIVFLDTNIFISKNYQFLTHSLGSLKKLCEDDEVHLIITNITIDEVKSHIRQESLVAAAAMKKIKKDAMVLRNTPELPAFGIFEPIQASQIEEMLLANFSEFLGGNGVEILTVDQVAPSRVFNRYFLVQPPFAMGAKEKEFADAFVLERLVDFTTERMFSVHVISTDKDLHNFCEEQPALIFSESVDEFISAVNTSVSVEPAAFAAEALEKLKPNIIEYIEAALGEVDFEIRSSDWGAELEEIEIRSVELLKANLVSVEAEWCVFEMDFLFIIETVESVKDYDRSPFDHEDNSYPFVLETQVSRTFESKLSVEVTISYQDKLLDTVELGDVDMPYGITLSNPLEEHRQELDVNGD